MKRSALIVAALALPLIAGSPAAGQGTAPSPTAPADAVVATVNGEDIIGADVQDFFETLPPQYRQLPIEQIYPQLVERLVDQRLLASAARSSGVADTPAFKKQLKMLTDGLLQEAYLNANSPNAACSARFGASRILPCVLTRHSRGCENAPPSNGTRWF